MNDVFAWIDTHPAVTVIGLALILIAAAVPLVHALYTSSRIHKDAEPLAGGKGDSLLSPAPRQEPSPDEFDADHSYRPRIGR